MHQKSLSKIDSFVIFIDELRTNKWVKIAGIPIFAFLVAVGANIAIPLPGTPVPATLQVPMVLLAGAFLGRYAGSGSLFLYVLLGILGLPFFASGGAGLARIFGPTGGYLLGFILAAYVVGFMLRIKESAGIGWTALSFVSGLICIFSLGLFQLNFFTNSIEITFQQGLFPFVSKDIVELVLLTFLYHFVFYRWQLK